MIRKQGIPLSTGLIIWVLCIIGQLSVLPYLYSLGDVPAPSVPVRLLVASAGAFAFIFNGLLLLCSSYILKRVDLEPFASRSWRDTAYPAIPYGIVIGLAITALDRLISSGTPAFAGMATFPSWQRLLACLYGAINEEVVCRLFMLPAFVFMLTTIFRPSHKQSRLTILWSSILITALIFGAGHLPAAQRAFGELSSFIILRVLLLNGLAGIVFGWVFSIHGFWAASLSHLIAGFILTMSFSSGLSLLLIGITLTILWYTKSSNNSTSTQA